MSTVDEEINATHSESWREQEQQSQQNGPEAANGQAQTYHFPLVRSKDVKLSTSPYYLVHGVIPREGLVLVWGPPKCGKSFWVFDLLMHVALGWQYRGRSIQQRYCRLHRVRR
jgi:hypothetical protein